MPLFDGIWVPVPPAPVQVKGYKNKGKDKGNGHMQVKGYNNEGKDKGNGKHNSEHRRANQTAWAARVRRSEKRQAKQQEYHDDEMQRMCNEADIIDADTKKQMQEIARERQEATL